MYRPFLILCSVLVSLAVEAGAQATVRVEPSKLQGPRILEEQTASAVLRDYLQSWKTLHAALERNQAGLLDRDFVGTAKDKLSETIAQQAANGISTVYQDQAHDIQIVFYSPEGLSVELIDKVTYQVQVVDHGKPVSVQPVESRYVVVMTPAEIRWRVRVFQTQSE